MTGCSSSLVQIARQRVGATTVLPIVLAGTAANKMPGRVAACTRRRNYRDVRFNPADRNRYHQDEIIYDLPNRRRCEVSANRRRFARKLTKIEFWEARRLHRRGRS